LSSPQIARVNAHSLQLTTPNSCVRSNFKPYLTGLRGDVCNEVALTLSEFLSKKCHIARYLYNNPDIPA
ncbi:hypothetical protein AB4Y38_42330, partial [Paraburkholderia sp. EG285A]|uniref:hypothetical protein n=1 Tax=Paraburkholderia sp. EG285A TaxID=3237009 RepID=UPI0034D23A92